MACWFEVKLSADQQTSQLVTGINQSESSVKAGKNANCRVFSYKDKEYVYVTAASHGISS